MTRKYFHKKKELFMRIKSSDEISNQHFFGSTKNCLAFSEMNTYLLNFNCQVGNLKIC